MKRFLAILMCLLMVLSIVGCQKSGDKTEAKTDAKPEEAPFKVGAVLVGDENEGYTYAHIEGIKGALKRLGLSEENVIWKYTVGETEACYDACVDCVAKGAKLVITNSYGHQSFCEQAAAKYPDVEFVAMTGDTAKKSGLANFHNAFTNIYEARYVGGVVAGMKLQQLIDEGKVEDKNKDGENIKIGYVGAYPYAEVVSGYTAFYLGIKSIVPNVVMDVQYTNSWFNITAESEAAKALIERGCIIIGQHADSTGAPATCEEYLTKKNTTVYSVGYNVDMLANAPTAALTSPTNEWVEYYTYAIGSVMKGEKFDTNWAKGFADNAVAVTKLGPSCAPGTQEKVDELIADFKAGKLNVFDTNTFTVGGAKVEEAFATDTDGDWVNDADNAVFDGYYHESYFQSAPSFSLRIDGITELN